MKIDVMGVMVDDLTMAQTVEAAKALIAQPGTAYIVTPNAEIVYEAMHDEAFRALLNSADIVTPDGAGVVLAAKLLGTPLRQKVAGIDLASNLLGVAEEVGYSLYLLGSKPGIGELAAENMKKIHPRLQICGIADGYFQDEAEVVAKINAAKPDILFVCLGAPKQELFMQAHKQELNTSLMLGLGGSLDGFAGTVKRAPGWMIRLNLEWLYRLLREPKRLGRMMRLPKFLLAVLFSKGGKQHG